MLDLDIIKKELIYKEEECGKFKSGYLLIDFMYSSLGRKAINNFLSSGNKIVGIYGAGVLGRCLFDCIKNDEGGTYEKPSVIIMDQNGSSDYFNNQKIYIPNERPKIDIIIVTLPPRIFEAVSNNLIKLGYENIVSLDYVLYAQSKLGGVTK